MNKNHRGVTLIELMVVVVIIGILAAIAYPSYRAQVLRSHRSDAKIALERTAQTLERCYTNSLPKGYAACPVVAASPISTDNGYYSVAIATDDTVPSFTLTATAVGGQLQDTGCRTLTLTNTNLRGAKNASSADNVAECWGR
jgi:type IV pilus assembly protein PilE